jgi:hypothetical protein
MNVAMVVILLVTAMGAVAAIHRAGGRDVDVPVPGTPVGRGDSGAASSGSLR